jgi:hypothetical protein
MSVDGRLSYPEPPPLPEKIEDWVRVLKEERSLNDLVEDIHRILVNEDSNYRGYLRAVRDAQAKEGSLSADNIMAAQLIRQKAVVMGTEVANEKLATIVMSLGVVLRRYNVSRKQRRNLLGGTVVPDGDEKNGE